MTKKKNEAKETEAAEEIVEQGTDDTEESVTEIELKEVKPQPILIKPTIGRMVLFNDGMSAQRCAAQIAFVHSDTSVNLGYLDQFGNSMTALKVTLIQDTETECTPNFCEWMAYQVEQAK